jgi:hypothetical protein
MLPLLSECVANLNKLGTGEFSVQQEATKVSVYFGDIEVAWVDVTHRRFECPIFKTPLMIPDPPNAISKDIILRALLSCGIAVRIFGNQWRRAECIVVLTESIKEWVVAPPNVGTEHFLISVPPLGRWNEEKPYEVRFLIFPSPNEEPKIVNLKPSEIPDINGVRKIVALVSI